MSVISNVPSTATTNKNTKSSSAPLPAALQCLAAAKPSKAFRSAMLTPPPQPCGTSSANPTTRPSTAAGTRHFITRRSNDACCGGGEPIVSEALHPRSFVSHPNLTEKKRKCNRLVTPPSRFETKLSNVQKHKWYQGVQLGRPLKSGLFRLNIAPLSPLHRHDVATTPRRKLQGHSNHANKAKTVTHQTNQATNRINRPIRSDKPTITYINRRSS